jgi:endoglucanase
LRPLIAAVLAAAAVALEACGGSSDAGVTPSAPERAAATPGAGLHVAGNRLVDRAGRVVSFHGVNRSGTEYACIQGWGIFDGPSDAASVRAIAAWHVNAVRIPLNEDCWLGINGVKPQYSGASYRDAIVRYVGLLHQYGIYAELALIWAAPGTYRATYQSGAPDADHSPTFWSSLAATFKDDHNVVLAPWGETIVDAHCFLKGGVCQATYGPKNKRYRTAGMQQAVDVMRAAGYTGVIAIPGVNYANDLSHWLSTQPRDRRRQLIAEAHVYGKQTCSTTRCFNRTFAPVARRVPLIFGETGETFDGSDCGSRRIAPIIRWADAHRVGYEAWTWNTWGNCSALIADYAGAPHAAYGAWIKSHYAATPARGLGGQG